MMIAAESFNPPNPVQYTVAVRTLCEFTAQQGDLDARYGASPTAQEGQAGHTIVASRRGNGYEREIALSSTHGELTVRGRADGYDAHSNQLEEIKTYRGDLSRLPASRRALHWAQAQVYAWLLCEARRLPRITVALVYFNISTNTETVLAQDWDASDLRARFIDLCERFMSWARHEAKHRIDRDAYLTDLRFPYAEFRPGQRELAVAVFRAARDGHCLTLEAPTGIGKTLGTLFPVLKAMPAAGLHKAVFLTARTTGRQLALTALEHLRGSVGGEPDTGLPPLRVLELVARDKACEHPDKACTGESCPLARGFFDRLPAARSDAAKVRWLDSAGVRRVAAQHTVCPYYLGQEMARWADVVIGDYTYYFDHGALLHTLTQHNQWRTAVLVDEAHNLIDRVRAMYSARLEHSNMREVRRQLPALKGVFNRLARAWSAIHGAQTSEYQAYDTLPERLTIALRLTAAELATHFETQPSNLNAETQRFYFDILRFVRLAESLDHNSVFDVTVDAQHGSRRSSTLCVRNVAPAPFLASRFNRARSTVLFSATIGPQQYLARMLGLPESAVRLNIDSPFSEAQLQVTLATGICTRWNVREHSLAPMAREIAHQFYHTPGLYLAYFSSFTYMEQVAAQFATAWPNIPIWQQQRHMPEADRNAFLARFIPGQHGIGFAVLGGAFAEGIDLPGERLIGAFIATLGLPQINPVNEMMRERLTALFNAGYEYTYLYPGLQKVVQAAGRVIRTTADRGIVVLMDDRYQRAQIKHLLPRWWNPKLRPNEH